MSAGTATYSGGGVYDGMVSAIKALSVNGRGPFTYPEERFGNPFHWDAKYNLRFSTGSDPEFNNYGPSPHFAVPGSGTSSDFHVDSKTGPAHIPCAFAGVNCY